MKAPELHRHVYAYIAEGGYVVCAACEKLLTAEEWFEPCIVAAPAAGDEAS